jgi:hypothetical protein
MLLDYARFAFNQRIKGFSVPDAPHFDEASTEYFLTRLKQASYYLEYGCGGSTVEAARLQKTFVSVEGDPYYLNAVSKKIRHKFRGDISGQIIYANIGITGEWGYPIFKKPTPARLKKWRHYAEAPWSLFDRQPDLILVDGRFRVHCALYSLSQLRDQEFEILFDDYAGRDHYREVERFAHLEKMCGRMAVFKKKSYDQTDLQKSINAYASDYR